MGRGAGEIEHNVTLTEGFYGEHEVTQAQYEAVMTGNTESLSATPSHFSGPLIAPLRWFHGMIYKHFSPL